MSMSTAAPLCVWPASGTRAVLFVLVLFFCVAAPNRMAAQAGQSQTGSSQPGELKPTDIQEFRLPVSMGSASSPPGRFSLSLNGKPALDFDVALHDQAWQSADGKVRMSYMAMEDSSQESNGILTITVGGSLLQPGQPATFEVVGPAANSQRWFGVYLVSAAPAQATR